MGLFVDLAEFTWFYQFLHVVIIKLFCFDLRNIMQELVKQVNQQTIRCQVLV